MILIDFWLIFKLIFLINLYNFFKILFFIFFS